MKDESQEKDRLKWIRIMGLALSYPSAIFAVFYAAHYLGEKKIVSEKISFPIAIIFVLYLLSRMVYYALIKNDKR